MDFSEMMMMDEDYDDLDVTLFKAATDFVNALASKSLNDDSTVPELHEEEDEEEEDTAMDTLPYYDRLQESEIIQTHSYDEDDSWLLRIDLDSPPAPVPCLEDHDHPLENTPEENSTPSSADFPKDAKDNGTVQESVSVNRSMAGKLLYDTTPTLAKIDRPRAPKRKIFEVYQNPAEFYVKEKDPKPPIIMKFKLAPPPNPLSKEVISALTEGKVANPAKNVRANMLHGFSGVLPIVSFDRADHPGYEGISPHVLDQKEVRRKVNEMNKKQKAKQAAFLNMDLDKEYDRLLAEQIPHIDFDKKRTSTELFDDIFEFGGSIFIKLQEREIVVPPCAVLLQPLTEKEIDAFRVPPKDGNHRSAVSKFMNKHLNKELFTK